MFLFNKRWNQKFSLIAVLIFISTSLAHAQEINGDTVYVSTKNIIIQFPDSIQSNDLVPFTANYQLQKNQSSLSIHVKNSNANPAILLVTEGHRNHRFILIYSKKNKDLLSYYDYANLDKLKEHVWYLETLAKTKEIAAQADQLKLKPDPDSALDSETVAEPEPKVAWQKSEYELIISSADSALNIADMETALLKYKEALVLKPNEFYPNSQIRFITVEMEYVKKIKEEEAAKLAIVKENEFEIFMASADSAIKERRFSDAIDTYSKALKIEPANEQALRRYKIANDQLEKQNIPPDSSSNVAAANELKNILNSKFKNQKVSIPYSAEQLGKLFGSINFNLDPVEQFYDFKSSVGKNDKIILSELLADKPKFSFSGTSQKINLLCTNITFIDSVVYLKLLLQNDSNLDFLTGAMTLNRIKKNGQKTEIYPIYLYPDKFPIVKPGNQMTLIYVCKPGNISNEDNLKLGMTDRTGIINLQLTISGASYNTENYMKDFE